MKSLHFEHIRCPLHRYTFSVKAIRQWVEQTCEGRVLNLFAGKTKLVLDETRNDLDPETPADYHQDALTFLRSFSGEKFNTILLDPPYAYRKSMELYKGMVCSPFRQLKDDIPNCLVPGGLVITFGYHSIVLGRNRGFHLERLALFSHGGAIHDTTVSAERFATLTLPEEKRTAMRHLYFPLTSPPVFPANEKTKENKAVNLKNRSDE
jgi:hypothetical protein